MWALILVALLLVVVFSEELLRRPRLYPPGPFRLPLIGNLLSVAIKVKSLKYQHVVYKSWARFYGDILGLRLGNSNVVIIFGKDLIKEVQNREVFDGRPDGFFFTLRSFGKKLGIIFNDGPSWIKTKRVVLKYLKSFGYNSRCMESYISEECKALVDLRMMDAGKPVLANHLFHVMIINILWRLVAGKRFDLEDPKLKHLCELITRLFRADLYCGGILNFLPFLRYIMPNRSGYNEVQSINTSLHIFLREMIKQHEDTLDVQKPRDLVDALLIERMENKDESLTEEEIQIICLDLMEAGIETVSNTSVFMLLHIVRNEDVQKKIHAEIDEVIGSQRTPSFSDRTKMVYTEALILETLRISTVPVMSLPHMALEDARLGNYIIPKGTFMLLAMHDLHNSPRWKDPYTFRPERFITKERNLVQDDFLIPFGAGKRRCIGEGLSRYELFMFITHCNGLDCHPVTIHKYRNS